MILATMIIGGGYQRVLATNIDNNINADNSRNLSLNSPTREEDITLDGMIGPYDPYEFGDNPDFSQISDDELEGELPVNYYTISVTVPTRMQFTAISDSFFSPQYTIENNAPRPIYVTVTNLEDGIVQETDQVKKLHLKTPDNSNDDIEAEVLLTMLNTTTSTSNTVKISDFNVSAINYLGVVSFKESATLEFESSNWERPGIDAPNASAKNNFKLELTFSLDDPTQPIQP